MKSSLRALLNGIIDYAGLFPPARLPLAEAVTQFARYQDDPEAWMLSRFICPASKLGEMSDYCSQLFTQKKPLLISALGRNAASREEYLESVALDAQAIDVFLQQHNDRARADVFEVRLPVESFSGNAQASVRSLILQTAEILDRVRTATLRPFFEIILSARWRAEISATLAALKTCNSRSDQPPGFKLRCGGLEAATFPSVEQVAFCLNECRNAGVPFKATAGLHHPFRHFASAVQAEMHGFINVFGAGILATSCDLSENHIQRILTDEDSAHFKFQDEDFCWGEFRATTEQITSSRRDRFISFGSCSFDEPREDLRELGWM